jgi:hypothetical protein
MQIVYGVDPDSKAFGVAEYQDGVLSGLFMLDLFSVIDKALRVRAVEKGIEVLFSIENVMANQFVYTRNQKASKAAQSKVAMSIGRCQQAQVELMRMLEHRGIPYVLHNPQEGNWADKRELFQKITGWKGNSNPDTRSAAYFGFLALNQSLKGQK